MGTTDQVVTMGPTDHITSSLEVQPHHLFQMQDKHKTIAAMKKKKKTWK